MRARDIAGVVGVVIAVGGAPASVSVPLASAVPCPDVEVVFARGTTEDPGVGPTGQAFVDSLRGRIGPRTMNVYPVDYPATTDFPTAVDGIRDASNHIEATARNCPATSMVLGGFSQGAAVMGFVTANIIPDGAPDGVPNPMPPDVADHVAAVALLGKPNERFMHTIGQPAITVGPQYAGKTIDLCVPEDFVCSSGRDFNAHTQYFQTGMVDQAALYAATLVAARPAPVAPLPSPPASAPPPAPGAPPAPPAPAPPGIDALRPLPPGTLLMCKTTCQIIGPA